MIRACYHKKHNIVYSKLKGEVNSNDIFDLIETVYVHNINRPTIFILLDTVKANLTLKLDVDLQRYMDSINNKVPRFEKVLIARVVNDPQNVIASILFEELCNEKCENLGYKTFSTRAAAKSWLSKNQKKPSAIA